MPNKVPWPQRTFDFDFPVDRYPQLLERLRRTPTRVEQIARSLSPPVLVKQDGETWSIQENIGHLADLESLFTGRLDDFEAKAQELRAADMTNRKTHQAMHNARPINEVLNEFRSLRQQLLARLEALSPADFSRTARHPRLQKPMRIVDMLLFHAEHDDYHLERIGELVGLFS